MNAAELDHKVVSAAEWLEARTALLAKEKELVRQRDELSRQRRELPWVRVEKDYVFDGPRGRETLGDLFAGRSQLIVYHFMFGPGWQEGCPFCSFLADGIDGTVVHLAQRDVTLTVVSRAPLPDLEAFKKRMGWRFSWVSSYGSDFNYDFHVSFTKQDQQKGEVYYNYALRPFASDELPGTSVFFRDESGAIFHTYSSFARGGEALIGTYNYLDLAPKGRNETGPRHDLTDWVRHHDRYPDQPFANSTCCTHDHS